MYFFIEYIIHAILQSGNISQHNKYPYLHFERGNIKSNGNPENISKVYIIINNYFLKIYIELNDPVAINIEEILQHSLTPLRYA